LFGVEERTVTNWVNSVPPIPRRREGQRWGYDLAEVLRWWTERQRRQLEETQKPGTMSESEERLAAAKAQLAELELDEARGNLARREDVERAFTAIHERVRARLMSLPAKAAPALVGIKRAVDIQVALEGYVEEVVGELRDWAA
jgi:phage terminase Nu1 subunit (DNA packaging protein)